MPASELYTKGARVWVPDAETVWASAQLLQGYRPGESELFLQLSDGREVRYPVTGPGALPPLGNPEIQDGESDLTALSHLHEPAVLHNLRLRFLDYSCIYTYCGIVLVAINPYEQLPIYGEEVIDAYSGQDTADMDPHIFSVAEEAYRQMAREERNQSIIISGESGAGKTVSAKFAMRYFAVVGGSAQQTSVEERVLATNPIMEAFGNAKTTRNDNSSRFGKYIEIGFGCQGDIIGAHMRTYLLEKSRVVFQAPEERNYHIFYQLCTSWDLPELSALRLAPAEQFRYTRQGGGAAGTADGADLERTRRALAVLGVQADQQMELFRILAALLHLGNIEIRASSRDGERSSINADDVALAVFVKMLGVERSQMAHWLCHRRLVVAGETLVKPMPWQQACEARDALAKHVYGQLFSWVVRRLNAALRAPQRTPKSFIGVLDIYGFEMFERNSFEQFCINYANEKLQQQFTQRVFQLEQEEYVREGIPWSRVEFSDNQPCIALIEGPLGVLDLLDEECRMPKGSDESWARKLYEQQQNQNPNPHFRKPRMSDAAFVILHFADTVQYECEGFLDKNRDTVFEEPINILKASQSELVAELFQEEPAEGALTLPGLKSVLPNGSLRAGRRSGLSTIREYKQTVGFQFRQSLRLLMDTLNSTTPHYVRCIKPNDLKQPFLFDPKRAVQQLRACGVLETIRISATGYPSRWSYPEFFSRYRVLIRDRKAGHEDQQAVCRRALGELISDSDQYWFGKTKIFFRAGQVALLERLRAERLHTACVTIQSRVRGWLGRRRYGLICQATLTLQRYIRGALARRLAQLLRVSRAVLLIQRTFRMVQVRRLYLQLRSAAVTIQAAVRGALARRAYRQLVAHCAATVLQARVRGWLARRGFLRVRQAALCLQCCYRRLCARRELRRRRAAARSVERYRELHKGMEVKLIQLQRRADEQARESTLLREALGSERAAHRAELARLQGALERLQEQGQGRSALARLQEQRQQEEEEQRRKAAERDTQEIARLMQEVQALREEKAALEAERETLCTRVLVQESSLEERVAQQVARSSSSLHAELEEERRRYQGLLRDFGRLEQRYDNLREEVMLAERSHGHRRTDSSQSLVLGFIPPVSPGVEEADRRISVTSPSPEGRTWILGAPWDSLMEAVGVAKDGAERMRVEDLRHAYDAVRVANKILESQLLSQRSQWEGELSALRQQAQGPRQEGGASDLALSPLIDTPLPRPVQEQLAALVSDNMDLMEQVEAAEQECRRLRRELRDLRDTLTLINTDPRSATPTGKEGSAAQQKGEPSLGLLECKKKDEAQLLRTVVTDLRPDTALSLPPGLPACLLFLCIRHLDWAGEEARVRSLCAAVVSAIKGALKKHSANLDMTALWLRNSFLLTDLLTQHSTQQASEQLDSVEETPRLTFDLSGTRQALSNLSIQAYHQLLGITESRLQPLIVPAMLESETIPGLSSSAGKAGGSRKRASGASKGGPGMAAVLQELGALDAAMTRQALCPQLRRQAFQQLSHLLAATALNSLLLRRDVCSWSRGLQIRYNISQLEEWLRSRSLQTGGTMDSLEPLIQAAQLLQVSKKSEEDARAIVETCTALSSQQIVKILSLYTPHSEFEERVTLNFIRTVQALLTERAGGGPRQLLLDVRRVFPVTFPYLPPPPLRAEQLDIPACLGLAFLRRV
ncbi:unconventional myosin-Vb [Lepisosteus oculatus]|uniref:unconventional myosin-Vb n=1 Tax=Lepisosteus oculatus TaxID=7918 RepID=UPI00370FF49E